MTPTEHEARLTVKVYPYRPAVATGNIVWDRAYPMRGGRFPAAHPVGGGLNTGGQYGSSVGLDAFRARGYWASCFPEGDGITWKPERGQSDEQCLADIRACWPAWEVRLGYGWKLYA